MTRARAAVCVLLLLLLAASLPQEAAGTAGPASQPDPRPSRAASPPGGARKVDANRNKIFDDLEATLAAPMAAAGAEVQVLVALARPVAESELSSLLSTAGRPAPKRRFASVPGLAVSVPRSAVPALAASPLVKHVELDGRVSASIDKAGYWFGAQAARETLGATGDLDGRPTTFGPGDVVVAVIDTGIDAGHPDFTGKVVGWHDLVNGLATPYDDSGHGTHVAGIIAGLGAGDARYVGVAPGAALVGVKALDSKGEGYDSDVVAALDWVTQHRAEFGIRVVNLSLGGPGPSDGTDYLSLAVEQAVASGLVVVVAAGNDGPAPGTVGYPGAAPGAITVGAMADPDRGGFHLAGFSSRGPTLDGRTKPDVSAPGVRIVAANRGSGYVYRSGTSMATPFVAGVAALMLSANPALSPTALKALLASTAADWGAPGMDNEYGNGKLDVYAAVAAAAGQGGAGPIQVPHSTFSGQLSGRGVDWYSLQASGGTLPIAVTLINRDWTLADPQNATTGTPKLGVALLDSTGAVAGKSPSFYQSVYQYQDPRHQETVSKSGLTGPLRLAVYSVGGTGTYALDISGATATKDPPPAAPTPTPTPQGWISLFSDDGERLSGTPSPGAWTAALPWTLSDADFHSPGHAWAHSPYTNYVHASLTSRAIDLSGVADPRLRFWTRYDLQYNKDFVYLEGSTDGGATYAPVDPVASPGSFTGFAPSWHEQSLSLARYAGAAVRLRFRLQSDGVETGDGWWLDDLAVEGFPVTPTATPSPTPTATPSLTPTPTATPSPTPTATAATPGAAEVTLDAQVELQRPVGAPPAALVAQVDLWVFPAGGASSPRGSALYHAAGTTAPDGHVVFDLPGLAAGAYDLVLKGSHTLGNLRGGVQLVAGTNAVALGTLLEGDVTGDNWVDASDLSVLAWRFGLSVGQPGFDPRADLNQDGTVDVQDFTLLAANFGLLGDLRVP